MSELTLTTSKGISSEPDHIDQLCQLVENWKERPSWDEYFMATALLISSRSSCQRLHVGYNGFLPGAPHHSRVRDGHEQATVHAEQNAVADAARRGISLEGATAYLTHFPCINCAKILASAGIRKIIYHHDYKNDPLVPEILAEAGIAIGQF